MLALITLLLISTMPRTQGPGSGDLFVTNFGGHTVTWYHGADGTYGGTFIPEGSGGLNKPVGLAFGRDGDLYVSSAGTNQVLRYDGLTGAFKQVFAEDARLQIPSILHFGPDSDLFVGTFQGGRVLRFDGRTGAFKAVSASGLAAPIGFRFDSEGRLCVASAGQDRIARFTPATGAFLDDLVNGGRLVFPAGICFAPDGSLLVASLRSGEVLRFDGGTGGLLGPIGDLPPDAGPAGIVVDPEGRIFVTDMTNSTLSCIERIGEAASVVATEGLSAPEGIAIKPR